MTEEEQKIIDVFSQELKEFGHDGYCSFTDNVDNGYYTFKDGDNWVYDFNEKGKTIKTERYTNIYNLCIDILEEMKIDTFFFKQRGVAIPKGTIVIITKQDDCPKDEILHGRVIGSFQEKKEHGGYEVFYQVIGDDERIYTGPYGLNYCNQVFFRTMEDYIKDIEKERKINIDTIKALVETNEELFVSLQEVMLEKTKLIEENTLRKY